jgi:hypothetical protein
MTSYLPVARDRQRHRFSANGQWENFPSNDPGDGTPRRSEEGDVDTHQGHERLLTGGVMNGDGDTDNCNLEGFEHEVNSR